MVSAKAPSPLLVDGETARRFFVDRHSLSPARSVDGGSEGVLAVLRTFGSIQFDPIATAGRNHDLMLHARVKDYRPAWCDLLYEQREIFETTNKALSLVPMAEMPFYRWGIGRKGRRFHIDALTDNAEVAEHVLARITVEGPLSVRDFEASQAVTSSWHGISENAVRAVLEAYTVLGDLGLARREGSVRHYDLLARLLPPDILAVEVPVVDQLRHRLLSRYRAHGLLGASGGGGSFDRIASPQPMSGLPGRNDLRRDLISSGSIVPVKVDGLRSIRYVIADEVELLTELPVREPTVAFIPPFDAMLWDSTMIEDLFGFEHVWEGFFPPAKRRWGRYVLPILFGDRFVGRIEPQIDRNSDSVQVLNLWWEDAFNPRDDRGFVDAFRAALTDYLALARASRAEWAAHLRSEQLLVQAPS